MFGDDGSATVAAAPADDTSTAAAAVASDQSTVNNFQNRIQAIRAYRVQNVQQTQGLQQNLSDLQASQTELLNNFQQEATDMYPQLQGQPLAPVVTSLQPTHPLAQVWQQYRSKINDVTSRIASTAAQVQGAQNVGQVLAQQESDAVSQYADFAANGASTPVPTPDQLLSVLTSIDSLPTSPDGSTNAYLPAIEWLNPMAADMVMAQALAQGSMNYPCGNESYYQGEYDDSEQSCNGTQTDSTQTPTAAVSATSAVTTPQPVIGPAPGFSFGGLLLAVGAFYYVFLTGNKA